jgi:phosphoribosyl 1,2-cyclic phosphate phosphodiesterase
MHIFFLGTAAAEGFPGIFCRCEVCSQARQQGGHNQRFRSMLLVNDDLLIDCGPDLQASALKFNRSLWGVTTCLVTHAHSDHFYPGNFGMRADAFTGKMAPPRLRLYGSQDVSASLAVDFTDLSTLHLDFQRVRAFDTWQSGAYTITAYHALHAMGSLEALFYSVDDGKHALLYATDTGLFPGDTRQALLGRSFDVIVLEETMGTGNYEGHLGFESFPRQVSWFHEAGLLRPGGRVLATHFSHSGNPLHTELAARFVPLGVEVAYDGLEIVL